MSAAKKVVGEQEREKKTESNHMMDAKTMIDATMIAVQYMLPSLSHNEKQAAPP